jgi:hypothetical protein
VDRSRFVGTALQPRSRDDAVASTASHPNVRDDRDTPLVAGRDSAKSRDDLGQMKTEIFLQTGLDKKITMESFR